MNNEERKIFWDTLCILDVQDGRQKNFEKIKATLIYPKELCKFKKVDDYSLLGLQTNQLYISSADKYDDPFDTFIHIDWQEVKENNNCLKQLYEQLRLEIQQNSLSICFTEQYLNETLWLKYADNHKGFCLVYDDFEKKLSEIKKQLPKENNNPLLLPVYYSPKPYTATEYAKYLLYKWYCRINKLKIEPKLEMQFNYSQLKISLIKKECHKYDQEWRYLSFDYNKQYLEWKPSKIIIGLRTPKHHIELIKNSAKIAGIQNIYQVYINEKDELAIQKLEI